MSEECVGTGVTASLCGFPLDLSGQNLYNLDGGSWAQELSRLNGAVETQLRTQAYVVGKGGFHC